MRPSSQSRRHTPSVRDLVMSSNLTSVGPVIIWQTRDQRKQQDLVGLAGIGGEKRKQIEDRRCWGGGRDESTSVRGGESTRHRRWREESPPGRRRGQSCSRIRSYSRGRSRSPRRAGEPGPGILKGRSATHDGRKREGSVGWKMFRINRVEEVREFSPWPEERLGQGRGGEDDGEVRGNEVEEDVTRQIEQNQLLQENRDEKVEADDTKKTHNDIKTHYHENNVDDHDYSLEVTITPTRRVAKIIKLKNTAREDVCVEAIADVDHDGNNNDVISNDIPEDDVEEQYFHGFDPLLDRDPLLPVAATYDSLIEELEAEDTSPLAGWLEVHFPGGYQSCPVQCVYKDCQATSLPSTLGLLPLPQAGHQWLCAAHSHCLLCPDPTFPSTSVRCTMCARLFHTDHLQMEELFEDKLERELFICKLCSDPDQFTQQGKQVRENSTFQPVASGLSSLSHPSPASDYTKIKPRTHSTAKVTKPRTVISSSGKALQHSDPSLPPGWHRQLVSSGSRMRVVIIGPDGRRFWSRSDLRKAHSGEGKKGIKWEEFSFSVFGSKTISEAIWKQESPPQQSSLENTSKISPNEKIPPMLTYNKVIQPSNFTKHEASTPYTSMMAPKGGKKSILNSVVKRNLNFSPKPKRTKHAVQPRPSHPIPILPKYSGGESFGGEYDETGSAPGPGLAR